MDYNVYDYLQLPMDYNVAVESRKRPSRPCPAWRLPGAADASAGSRNEFLASVMGQHIFCPIIVLCFCVSDIVR